MAAPHPDVSSLAAKTFDALFAQMRNELHTKNTKLFKAEMSAFKEEAKAQLKDSLSNQVKKAVAAEVKQATNIMQQKQTAEWDKTKEQNDALAIRVKDLEIKVQELTKATDKSRSAVEKIIDKKLDAIENLVKDQSGQLEHQLLNEIGETQEALALQVDNLTNTREELKRMQVTLDDITQASETAVDESLELGELPIKPELQDLLCLDDDSWRDAPSQVSDPKSLDPPVGWMSNEDKAVTESSALQALVSLLDSMKHTSRDEEPVVRPSQNKVISLSTDIEDGLVSEGDDDRSSQQLLPPITTLKGEAHRLSEDQAEIKLPERDQRSY